MASAPVAWYWPESTQCDERALIHRLERAMTAVLPELPRGWCTVDDAAEALGKLGGRRVIVVIDDFHVLCGTPAEGALERLVEFAPPGLSLLIASRVIPGFNLPRLRVLDSVLEIDSDDLRFRSWEVEQLFRDFYDQHLPPDELATLTRRTQGWAAALQLFHVATRGRDTRYHRHVLAAINTRSRLVREFLTRNVVDELPEELRSFLIDTSVLGRLSGALCDQLLGMEGSIAVIQQLERRQLVVSLAEEMGEYRCHEVLRSHLESLLVDQLGEADARVRYRHAGELLEGSGATIDAARAYARAEAWGSVRRVVGRDDLEAAGLESDLMDILPPGVRDDPWLMLAQARRYRADGRFDEAARTYKDAATRFGSSRPATVCKNERRAIEAWLNSDEPRGTDWVARLRRATIHAPLPVASPAPSSNSSVHDLFADGVSALLAGRLRDASQLLEGAAKSQFASPALSVAARLGFSVVTLLSGDARGTIEAEMAAEDADRLGLTWIARLCRVVLALGDVPGSRSEGAVARIAFEQCGDRWGSAIASLIEGLGLLREGDDASRSLLEAVERLRPLNAPVIEAWGEALHALALARSGHAEAGARGMHAEAAARACGARAAQGLACLAVAEAEPQRAQLYRPLAEGILDACGISVMRGTRSGVDGPYQAPTVSIRCFGGFELRVDESLVDLSQIKPRAREALRLLCLHGGRAVHREVLLSALWPDVEVSAGIRNLHVALSSLRSILQVDGAPFIVRDGSAYRVMIPEYGSMDLIQFERALQEARRAQPSGDPRCVDFYRHALDLYQDLLPEDGPAEWVVPAREQLRTEAYVAARELAQLLLTCGEPMASAAACERGLQIDPYRDDLWRLRIDALGHAGDFAAAAHARQSYDRVLTELGVSPTSAAR